MRLRTALVVAVAAMSWPAFLAEFQPGSVIGRSDDLVFMAGEIVAGDDAKLTDIIDKATRKGRYIGGIYLNSPGGLLSEGIKLSRTIRASGMHTVVTESGICASACFVAFSGSKIRNAVKQPKIGVHSASEADGARAGDATVAMAMVVNSYSVPPAIVGMMVVTPPSQMVWLDADDMKALGIVMLDPERR